MRGLRRGHAVRRADSIIEKLVVDHGLALGVHCANGGPVGDGSSHFYFLRGRR